MSEQLNSCEMNGNARSRSSSYKTQKVKSFLESFTRVLSPSSSYEDAQRKVWETLSTSLFEEEQGEPKRESSLFVDGTPFGTSLCLTEKMFKIRALVEVGGLHRSLPEQIDHSLRTLIELYQILGWYQSTSVVNWFCRQIFPSDSRELENWWGGIWMGVVMGPNNQIELRIYFNLRSGSLLDRWNRIDNLLEPFSQGAKGILNHSLRIASIESTAIPVGIGIVLTQDELKGVRLYQGLEKTRAQQVSSLLEKTASPLDFSEEIVAPLSRLEKRFGFTVPQGLTVSHDFQMRQSKLCDQVARVKCDVNCQPFVQVDADGFEDWVLSTLNATGEQAMKNYAALLSDHFGGASLDYFSLGAQTKGSHRTLYVKPAGLSPEGE